MIEIETVAGVSAGFCLLMFTCYAGGWFASRGWHKGKLEFVRRIMSDATEGS